MPLIYILHLCLSARGTNISFVFRAQEGARVVLYFLYCYKTAMRCFTSACVFLFSSRIWEKFVLPVSSCLHWMYWNRHLSSYFLDGRPGTAADVSNCRIFCGNPWILLVAFLSV